MMTNDPDAKSIEKGRYRHSKTGNLYEVIGVALHSETNEQFVIYKALYEMNYELLARPYDMFVERIDLDGEMKPRFERIVD